MFFTNWIKKNKVEAVVNISTLIPATNITQHLMMIITIVKYSEYIYVILMTQIEGIYFFYNLTLNFQNCGPFNFFTRASIFECIPTFFKIPIAQNLSVTE